MTSRRPSALRLAVPLSATALLVLAGPGAAPSVAAKRHRPCPTGGSTLYRSGPSQPVGLRVYRTGDRLFSCVRAPRKARRIRTLGPWTRSTKVAVGGAELAWTTRTTAPDGSAVDTIRAVAWPTGKRTLTVVRAAVATGPATPAGTDAVRTLRTDGRATVWSTSRGRLALQTSEPDLVPADAAAPYFHVGGLFALRDVGPGQASAFDRGVSFVDSSETDDCGGDLSAYLTIPATDGTPATAFTYYSEPSEPSPDCG